MAKVNDESLGKVLGRYMDGAASLKEVRDAISTEARAMHSHGKDTAAITSTLARAVRASARASDGLTASDRSAILVERLLTWVGTACSDR